MAVYYQGALPWSEIECMSNHDLMFYYRIMERQQAEEEVRNEFLCPQNGKPKPLPPPKRMRELVEKKLEDWKK